jgi:hypothetical protein
MTIRSILRHHTTILFGMIEILMACTVVVILLFPSLLWVGIPRGTSAWWNEKPIFEAVINGTLADALRNALP